MKGNVLTRTRKQRNSKNQSILSFSDVSISKKSMTMLEKLQKELDLQIIEIYSTAIDYSIEPAN